MTNGSINIRWQPQWLFICSTLFGRWWWMWLFITKQIWTYNWPKNSITVGWIIKCMAFFQRIVNIESVSFNTKQCFVNCWLHWFTPRTLLTIRMMKTCYYFWPMREDDNCALNWNIKKIYMNLFSNDFTGGTHIFWPAWVAPGMAKEMLSWLQKVNKYNNYTRNNRNKEWDENFGPVQLASLHTARSRADNVFVILAMDFFSNKSKVWRTWISVAP